MLLGAFRECWLVGTLASLAIVLAAMYMLRWISAVLHDPPAEPAAGGATGMPRPALGGRLPRPARRGGARALGLPLLRHPPRRRDSVHGIVSAAAAEAGRDRSSTAIQSSSIQLGAILPAFLLVVGALVLLLVGASSARRARLGQRVVLALRRRRPRAWPLERRQRHWLVMSGQLATDRFADARQAIVSAWRRRDRPARWGTRRLDERIAEYYALLCFAAAGMSLLAAANSFVVAVRRARAVLDLAVRAVRARRARRGLARERAEVPRDRLRRLGLPAVRLRPRLRSTQARCASTRSARRSGEPAGGTPAILLLGIAMILAGLAFKASAAPFHMWTPDVYEGAPTAVTAFMATATKASRWRRCCAS